MAPKVSQDHRESRRTELLSAALYCFSERGFEATTIDDIVRFAGVSKGMIYTYFKTKEEVFLALVSDKTDAFKLRVHQSMRDAATAWDRLATVLRFYRDSQLRVEDSKWVSVYLEFFLSSSRDEVRHQLMEQRYEDFLALMQSVIEVGISSGEFRTDLDARGLSALYWALCDGLQMHFSQVGDLAHRRKVYENAIDMLRRFVLMDETFP